MTASTDPGHVGVRLLIVDDHKLVAGALALALRQRAIEVEVSTGSSCQEIIDTAARFQPDLALLDLELGMVTGTGLDVIHPLVEAGVTVVIMTGVTERTQLAACIEAGAIGIISKEGHFDELVDTVRRCMAGEEILTDNQRQEMLAELRAHRSADRDRLRPFHSLTAREQSVLERLVAGDSAEVIAAKSYVSLATVRTQIQSILRKLGVNSQLAAVAMARRAGWSTA